MDITNAAISIVVFAFAILTGVFMPYLVQKYGQDNVSKAMKIIGILVRAAEQIFKEARMGTAKLKWVEEEFAKHGFKIDMSLVRAMIEAEVFKLKQGPTVNRS